jgi:ADP-ribose pyrophosphatase
MSDEAPRPWQTLGTRLIWHSQWYDLRQDIVRTHAGAVTRYTYQDHPGAVMVLPLTADRRVVMLRQYRYLLDAWCWELPAGGLHPGETPEAAARRELAEETGHTAGRVELLLSVYPSKSVSNERLHLFLAREATPAPAATSGEATELLRVEILPLAEAVALVHAGAVVDGQTALTLLLAAARLAAEPAPAGA